MPLAMEKKSDSLHPDQWLKDLPRESQIESFKPEEMLRCDKCQRPSPPTRLKCFYCGAELQISAEQSKYLKPSFRKLEEWEKGFNLIYLSNSETVDVAHIAKLINFEKTELENLFEINQALPLARLESQLEAEVLAERLQKAGVECKIVSDEQLKPEAFPRRLRGIDFFEDKAILILFNADEIAEIPFAELGLIVVGAFFERRIESTESLKKKDQRKILESAEMSTDEILIDLYSRQDPAGYRIETKGFDYSCLGPDKGLFAKDNIKILAEKLRLLAPEAKFDNNYFRLRSELSQVWEVSQRNDSSGLKRQGMGKFSRTSTVIINNLTQFTRYSRLQWHNL
jgi:hypothetical protein